MIKDKVTSLELAKQLKSQGYPQEGEFWWFEDTRVKEWTPETGGKEKQWRYPYFYEAVNIESGTKKPLCVAPLPVELGFWLPRTIEKDGKEWILKHTLDDFEHNGFLYSTHYTRGTNHISGGGFKTEANSRASMILFLIKEGHINFKEEL